MSQLKNTRSSQILFLQNFVEVWEKIEHFDDDNALFVSVETHLTEMLLSFCAACNFDKVSADELLAELQAMPTLYNWEQLTNSGETKDLSGVQTPEIYLWDKGQNIDMWYPVINTEQSTKRFFIKDLSGRGFTNNYADLLTVSKLNDKNFDGEDIITWAIDAEEGDEFSNNSIKIICIEG